MDEYLPLFVYGTLKSSPSTDDQFRPWVIRRTQATVMGRWEETGANYPGVTFDEPEVRIAGELIWIDRDKFPEALAAIDSYEGVPNLYRRVRVAANMSGKQVAAYAYQWREATI